MAKDKTKKLPKHSKLGPSSAGRWMNCPGSVALCDKLPKQETSVYAEEGSAAHYLGEKYLGNDVTPKQQEAIDKWYSEDMEDYIQGYVRVIRANAAGVAKELYVETKFHLEYIHPLLFGTADAVTVEPFGLITVDDLKYGRGIVEIDDNPQQMIYALGALHKYGIDNTHIKIEIYQPRMSHIDGPRRSQTMKVEDLVEWGNTTLKDAAYATEDPNAPLVVGPWCQKYFCPGKSPIKVDGKSVRACPALRAEMYKQLQADFDTPMDEIILPDVDDMSVGDMAKILMLAPILESYFKEVTSCAHKMIHDGDEVPGWKLVMNNPNRKLKSAKEIDDALGKEFGDEIYAPKKTLGIGKLEKLVGKERWKEIDALCIKPEPKAIVVPETDKRPAVLNKAALDFEPINSEEEK